MVMICWLISMIVDEQILESNHAVYNIISLNLLCTILMEFGEDPGD